MFLNDEKWATLENVREAVEQLRSRLGKISSVATRLTADEAEAGRYLVRAVRKRAMSCYPGWALYELTLDISRLNIGGGYEEGAIFALIHEKGSAEPRLFTGASPVIHELNALQIGQNGSARSPLRLETDEQYLEYLGFFCTFVAGEEGPFFVVDSPKDLPRTKDVVSFDAVVARRRKNFVWDEPGTPVSAEDMKKLLESGNFDEDMKELTAAHASTAGRDGEEEAKTRLKAALAKIEPPKPQAPEAGEEGYPVSATVLYGRHLFASKFRIYPTGMIEMTDDEPLAADLPVRKRVFSQEYPVLLLESEREQLIPQDFMRQFIAGAQPRNIRVTGDIDLTGRKLDARIQWEDLEFLGDVILDDVRSEFSVSLKDCRIGGRLHARNLICNGELKLRRIGVFGCYDRNRVGKEAQVDDHVALSLRGARIASTLDLAGASISGGLDATDIEVGGTADFSGLNIERREPRKPKRLQSGFLADGGRFKRGVSLGPFDDSVTKSRRPAFIVGGLSLKGAVIEGDLDFQRLRCVDDFFNLSFGSPQGRQALKAVMNDGLTLSGLFWADGASWLMLVSRPGIMDLTALQVKGAVDGGAVDAGMLNLGNATVSSYVNLSSQYDGLTPVETRLGGAGDAGGPPLNVNGATIGGSLMISGALLHGSLEAGGARVGGMIDGDAFHSLPTRIRGDVSVSGATVGSDMRFCGADIAGMISIITGEFRRVQLRPCFVYGQPGDEGSLKVKHVTVGGVLIQAATLDSLDLYALEVNGEGDDFLGSVQLDGVVINDRLGFFNQRPDLYLLHGNEDPGRQDRLKSFLPDACAMRSRIAKNLKMSDLAVKGSLNFTNLEVGGDIETDRLSVGKLIAGSRIDEKDVEAYSGPKAVNSCRLDAKSLKLERLACAGDADLSGIRIKGDVRARGASVSGKLEFADENKRHEKVGCRAEISGDLDLTSLKTPFLALSGGTPSGRLILERADISKLSLSKPLPSGADLRDMKLVQLDVRDDGNDHKAILKMLKYSEPFSRSIFRTVEKTLRDEGDDDRADEVYRQMRKRGRGEILRQTDRSRLFRGLHWLWEFLIGHATGYWTRSHRLLLLSFAATLIPSLLIFSLPENMAPTAFRLGESVVDAEIIKRQAAPPPAEWGAVETLRVYFAAHVPIIPFIEAPRWEPAENRNLCVAKPRLFPNSPQNTEPVVQDQGAGKVRIDFSGAKKEAAGRGDAQSGVQCPAGAWTVDWVSPAAYALFVKALFWLAWPLFLIGVSGVIQRKGA